MYRGTPSLQQSNLEIHETTLTQSYCTCIGTLFLRSLMRKCLRSRKEKYASLGAEWALELTRLPLSLWINFIASATSNSFPLGLEGLSPPPSSLALTKESDPFSSSGLRGLYTVKHIDDHYLTIHMVRCRYNYMQLELPLHFLMTPTIYPPCLLSAV